MIERQVSVTGAKFMIFAPTLRSHENKALAAVHKSGAKLTDPEPL
jgi:hypothetical protein